MLYLHYLWAELRRRRGRTILTALGLGIGVALVVVVSALSRGLDDAQEDVLAPLTGVGTDMSVSRPVKIEGSGSGQSFRTGGLASLPRKEQRQLEEENGDVFLDFRTLLDQLEPGEHFSVDRFYTTDLSFPAREARRVEAISGVQGVGPALTLSSVNVSGTAAESSIVSPFGPGGPGIPEDLRFKPTTISGVDASRPELALVTPKQIASGRYLSKREGREAVVSRSYAGQKDIKVGDTVSVSGEDFRTVGIASAPLGAQVSDFYVPLAQLQEVSDRRGRINVLAVRAERADQVQTVAASIEREFEGSKVTTTKELADRISGSLLDAKNLSNKLGAALAVVALLAAFLIASLLTLSSINKRVREIGTLKALGWPQWLVVRQISAETLAQGLLGGVIGAALGLAGAALVGALDLSLEATVAGVESQAAGGTPFGSGQVASGSSNVALDAPVSASTIALAVGLAILGGLIAGAVGSNRAARLRPAEALRSVE